jgi:hypothetical protein
MATDIRMIGFYIPDDPLLLAAVGTVSICHGHLDHSLKMMIKTFADVSVQETLDALAFESSSNLRDRIRKLARQRLGEGQALVKVQAFMGRCKRVTDKRNELIHSLYAHEDDVGPMVGAHDGTWGDLPKVKDVDLLALEITSLARELNTARLRGFIHEALSKGRKLAP